MEKLVLKKEGLYTIEVNDNGDTIEFDTQDIELPLKLEKTIEELNRINDSLRAKQLIISKKQDKEGKNGILTQNEKELTIAVTQAYKDMRKAMDSFLGEGACQKIFGNTNYYTMFHDLLDALTPHFKQMGINQEKMAKSIIEKYGTKENEELS